jgi:hypothetical protein
MRTAFYIRDCLKSAVRKGTLRPGDAFYTRPLAHKVPWRRWGGNCDIVTVVSVSDGTVRYKTQLQRPDGRDGRVYTWESSVADLIEFIHSGINQGGLIG